MDLYVYLAMKRISVTDFAKKLMVSRSYFNQIVVGRMKPSKRLAKDIEEATKGEVTVEELLHTEIQKKSVSKNKK